MFWKKKNGGARIKNPAAGSEREESEGEGIFYVFTVRGYAIDQPANDAAIREWAAKLQQRYDKRVNGEHLKLQLVSPDIWRANAPVSYNGGIVRAHYSMDDYTDQIRKYLRTLGIPEKRIDRGISLSEEHSSQLMNPGGGIYLIGIPIIG